MISDNNKIATNMWCSRPLSDNFKTRILTIILALIFITVISLAFNNEFEGALHTVQLTTQEQARRTHFAIISEFMRAREDMNTSVLGSWLFKYHTQVLPQKRMFIIHVDKYKSFGKDHLERCSVKNCIFTADQQIKPLADAVLVNLHDGIIPKVEKRDQEQKWIFLNDESPKHAYTLARKKLNLKHLANIFNWSMTYRSDSDVPIPFGRTVPLEEPILKHMNDNALTEIIPYWKIKRRDVLVTLMFSRCSVKIRSNFIQRLQKYIPVDVYGKCSTNETLQKRCQTRNVNDCTPISQYLFYLALENADCREYLTENTWYNAYMNGAIPIIMGPPISDCKRLLPPSSFIYITSESNETDIQELAKYITYLSENDDLLLILHQWRNHFMVINEHGYGRKSVVLCRLCEALNYNKKETKVYSEQNIRQFLGPKQSCGNNI